MPPLLPITIALIIGILLQYSGISAFFILIPLVAIIVLYFRKQYNALIIATALVIGFTISLAHSPSPFNSTLSNREIKFSGVIKEVKEFESSRMLIVMIDSCHSNGYAPFKAKIFIPSSLPVLDETDRIGFITTLSPLKSDTYLPDEIDYNSSLRQQGVTTEGLVEPDDILYSYPEPGILNSIFRMKLEIIRIIASTPLSPDTKNFLITTLTGDKSYLSPDIRNLFSHTGIAHVLALSGLHVGILSWIIFLALLPLQLYGMRHTRVIVTIIALWLFAIMTGLSPSVIRAVTMMTLFLTGMLLERIRTPFNSLCFAAIIILLFTPNAIFTIGFQLSFISVASILLLSERINPIHPNRRLLHGIISYLTVAIAAMIGTGVVSAYYFGIFPIYFLFTNIAASLLLPFILGSGIVITIAAAFSKPIIWLCTFVDSLYEAMIRIANFTSSLPGAYIDRINVSIYAVILYFMIILWLVMYLYKRRIVWLIFAGLTIIFSIAIIQYSAPTYSKNALYIPPSNSETSILIKEDNKLWLISTAHRIQIHEIKTKLERKYQKYMYRRNIDSISILPERYMSPHIIRNGNILHTSGKTFLIVNHSKHLKRYSSPIDYAIVSKGFKGNIIQVHDSIMADTILLGADIHLRRHNRYANELHSLKIPYKELRSEPLIME